MNNQTVTVPSPQLSQGLFTDCGDNSNSRTRCRGLALGLVWPAMMALAQAQPASNPLGPPTLVESRWQVVELHGRALALPQALSLQFGANGLLQGDTGCNRYASVYQTAAASLTVRDLRTTQAPCATEEQSRRQAEFLAVLAGAVSIAFDAQGQLVLFSRAGTLKAVAATP